MLILSLALLSFFGLFCLNGNKTFNFNVLFTVCYTVCILVLIRYSCFRYSCLSFQRDLLRLSLLFITGLLLLIAPTTQNFLATRTKPLYLRLSVLGLFSFLIFSTTNLLFLYISYEGSLLPIMYCIFKWGVYPERTLSALIILLFTRFFTFPLIIILLLSSPLRFSIIPFLSSFYLRFGARLWVIFRFAVKLPVFGLHYWLPMAHVEAPTFGSIILAGVLLKIGGCGLVRLSSLFYCQLQNISQIFSVFLMFGVTLSAILCCMQSDFKRLVAYSSVSHITLIFLLLLSPTPISFFSLILLIVFHGISSPILFFGVGQIRAILSTREIALFRGVSSINPLLITFLLITFLLVIPVPPFPAFLGELLVFFSILEVSYFVPLMIFLVLLIGLVYSLFWFSSIQGKIVSSQYSSFIPLSQYFTPLLLLIRAFSVLPILLL